MVCAFLAIPQVAPAQVTAVSLGKPSGTVTLYDVSGGNTSDARNASIFKNFSALANVAVQSDFNSDGSKFFAAEQNGGPVPWSVIEFAVEGDFIRARDQGFLQKLDKSIVPVSQLQPGTYDDYGIHVERYGMNLTYNTSKFPNPASAPKTMADLYNVSKFPGTRCLFKYPQFGGVLESALLADGVSRDKLYPLDVDRALKKLDTIKDNIHWWSSGDEAIRLISSGECSMGIAWSGRVYSAVTKDKAPLAMTWNDALYTDAIYAIPKGAPNSAGGQALIAMWIRDLEGQKHFVARSTYTTPITALNEDAYEPSVRPWIVAGANAKSAIPENEGFYAKNISAILAKFNRWLAM